MLMLITIAFLLKRYGPRLSHFPRALQHLPHSKRLSLLGTIFLVGAKAAQSSIYYGAASQRCLFAHMGVGASERAFQRRGDVDSVLPAN